MLTGSCKPHPVGSGGVGLQTCAESIDLDEFGIGHASCIDGGLIERITGMKLLPGVKRTRKEKAAAASSVSIQENMTLV